MKFKPVFLLPVLTVCLSLWVMADTVRYTPLSGVTTGTSVVYSLNNVDRVGLQVAWGTGVTAGQIVFETAPASDYAGTWTPVLTLDAPASVPSATADAADIAAAYGRVRVSTTVANGTATAHLYLSRNSR